MTSTSCPPHNTELSLHRRSFSSPNSRLNSTLPPPSPPSPRNPSPEALYRLGTLSHVIRSLTAAELRQQDGGADADAAARVSMVRVVAAFAGDTVLRPSDHHPASRRDARRHRRYRRRSRRRRRRLSRSEPNRDALRDAGALRRMAELLLHPHESVPQAAVQCIANLGVDASSAKGFLAAGWHLSLIGLLSSPSADVAASAAAVLGNLSSAPEFRHALMADGALQPILQLLHAPALPSRTAAVRALAIMSQQLMSTELPRGERVGGAVVAAIFDSAALPVLLKELDEPSPAAAAAAARRRTADPAADAAAAAAATAARSCRGAAAAPEPRRWLRASARLVDGGAVGALRFLSSHVAGDSGQLTPAAAAASGGPRSTPPPPPRRSCPCPASAPPRCTRGGAAALLSSRVPTRAGASRRAPAPPTMAPPPSRPPRSPPSPPSPRSRSSRCCRRRRSGLWATFLALPRRLR